MLSDRRRTYVVMIIWRIVEIEEKLTYDIFGMI